MKYVDPSEVLTDYVDPSEVVTEQPQPDLKQRLWASVPGRFLQGGVDAIDAGAQLLSRLGGPGEAARVDQMVKERGQLYDQAKAATGVQGFDLARTGGNVLLSALLTRGLGAPTTLPRMAAQGAGTGAALGALNPVTEGDFGTEKAKQMAVGGVTGGIAAPLTAGLAKAMTPQTADAAKQLIAEGVTPLPGQALGGAFKTGEEKMMSLPVLGAVIRNANQRADRQFNEAAINRALKPIGEKLPGGMVGREAISFTEGKLGSAYDDAINKIGSIAQDTSLVQDLSTVGNLMRNMPKEKADQFVRIVKNEIADRFVNGRMTGEGAKAAESNLGNLARNYQKSQDFDVRMLGDAIEEAQASLRRFVQRQAPPEASAKLKAANEGWANFKRVQRAASSVGTDEGVFTPAQLQNAVKAMDRSKDKGAFARGNALMQDLSEAGKAVMSPRVPNSGTPDRLMAAAAVGAPLAGMTLSPWMALAALPAAAYTRPGMFMATRAALGVPNALRGSAPALTAATLPLTYGLLNQ